MAGTRNGQRQGTIPFPGQYEPLKLGTPEQKSAPKPPAGDELADQLSTILEDMSEGQDEDLAPPSPPPGIRRRKDGSKAQPQFKVAQPEVNLGWLRRCVDNTLESAEPARQKKNGWTKWGGRLVPVIALLALLALYPAFRYILAAVPPDTQTVTNDVATPAPKAARQQRVPTIQVTPRQSRATAAPDVAPRPAVPAPAVAVIQPAAPPPVALPPSAAVVQSAVPPWGPEPAARPSVDGAVPQKTARVNPAYQEQTTGKAQLDPADAALLERGKKMMAYGDVAGARLAYSYLADRGNASGALALAESYDPELLGELSVIGLSGDREEAIRHYRRAAELGSLEAALRLTRLQTVR